MSGTSSPSGIGTSAAVGTPTVTLGPPPWATGTFAQEMRDLAQSLFNDAEFGDTIRDGIVSRTTPGAYDPRTQRAIMTPTSTTCRVLWTGNTPIPLSQELIRDAQTRNCKIGCLQLGFEVRPEDQLLVDGRTYAVLQCSDFSSGLGAVFEAVVR